MTLPVVLRDEASAEFDEAFDWYDRQRAGLGSEFASEVGVTLGRIARVPNVYPVERVDIRRAVVRRFPYSIFFRVHPSWIEVLAVFHTSRDPRVWRVRA